MTLLNEAYLELETGDQTAVFEFSTDLEYTSSLERRFVIGERGSSIQSIDRLTPGVDLGLADSDRRTHYWWDGGGGTWNIELSFVTSKSDNVQWGDGSGGDGPGNVTVDDASGEGIDALTRMQILQNWVARVKSDSYGYTRLYWGEHSDGTYAESAGVFNRAMPVAVQDTNFEKPEDDTSAFVGNISMTHVAVWPPWVDDVSQWVSDNISELSTELADYIQDA